MRARVDAPTELQPSQSRPRRRPVPFPRRRTNPPQRPSPPPPIGALHFVSRRPSTGFKQRGERDDECAQCAPHEPRAPGKSLPQITRPTETARPPHTPPLGRPERNARDLRRRKSATRHVPRVKKQPGGNDQRDQHEQRAVADRSIWTRGEREPERSPPMLWAECGSSRHRRSPRDVPSSTRASASRSARALGQRWRIAREAPHDESAVWRNVREAMSRSRGRWWFVGFQDRTGISVRYGASEYIAAQSRRAACRLFRRHEARRR